MTRLGLTVFTEDCAESPGHAKTLASEEDPSFIESIIRGSHGVQDFRRSPP